MSKLGIHKIVHCKFLLKNILQIMDFSVKVCYYFNLQDSVQRSSIRELFGIESSVSIVYFAILK